MPGVCLRGVLAVDADGGAAAVPSAALLFLARRVFLAGLAGVVAAGAVAADVPVAGAGIWATAGTAAIAATNSAETAAASIPFIASLL
jgi:hypothetical protein